MAIFVSGVFVLSFGVASLVFGIGLGRWLGFQDGIERLREAKPDSAAASPKGSPDALSPSPFAGAPVRSVLSRRTRAAVLYLSAAFTGGVVLLFSRNMALCVTAMISVAWIDVLLSDYGKRKRGLLMRDQLYSALHSMVGYLRAGYDITRVFELVVEETRAPLRGDIARVVAEHYAGVPFITALRRWAVRANDAAVWTFVKAIDIQRLSGGNLVQILFEIADAISQRRAVQRDVQAKISDPQLTALFLTLLPPALALFMIVIDPELLQPLLYHPTGKLAVSYSCASWLAGSFLARKLTEFEMRW